MIREMIAPGVTVEDNLFLEVIGPRGHFKMRQPLPFDEWLKDKRQNDRYATSQYFRGRGRRTNWRETEEDYRQRMGRLYSRYLAAHYAKGKRAIHYFMKGVKKDEQRYRKQTALQPTRSSC